MVARLYISFPIALAGPKRVSSCWWRAIGDATERYGGRACSGTARVAVMRRRVAFCAPVRLPAVRTALGKRFEFGARVEVKYLPFARNRGDLPIVCCVAVFLHAEGQVGRSCGVDRDVRAHRPRSFHYTRCRSRHLLHSRCSSPHTIRCLCLWGVGRLEGRTVVSCRHPGGRKDCADRLRFFCSREPRALFGSGINRMRKPTPRHEGGVAAAGGHFCAHPPRASD